eukprot:GCRY01002079.1.p1 GENE.GCRY01002079.1~~GCRY01002079.1.p1  ORF type:complete len:288 (+),score=62.01 GCRY01002079.1:123-986(+)
MMNSTSRNPEVQRDISFDQTGRVKSKSGKTQTWKLSNHLAEKEGRRNTVYGLDKSEYTGEWCGNKKEGKGMMQYSDGSVYDGEWVNDKRHGVGSFWVCVAPRTKTRPAKLRIQYEGEWCEGRIEGKGEMYYENGDHYEGEFVNGKRQGYGRQTYYQTSIFEIDEEGVEHVKPHFYEGDFNDDKLWGFGIEILPNMDRYEGLWVDNLKEGAGVYFYLSKAQRYDGEWREGIPKCGVMSEFVPEEADDPTGENIPTPRHRTARPLPRLTLKDPSEVLLQAMQSIPPSKV